jgi:hypothetical protein
MMAAATGGRVTSPKVSKGMQLRAPGRFGRAARGQILGSAPINELLEMTLLEDR